MSAELFPLFERLWHDYIILNPHVQKVRELLESRGERIQNDHIAFRTWRAPGIGIGAVAHAFVEAGYEPRGSYAFTQKKLFARHYEPPTPELPKVFVSELLLEECSDRLNAIVRDLVRQVPETLPSTRDFCASGRPWTVSHRDCEELRRESEYAAWLAAFGFRANHFTVSVNALRTFPDLQSLNEFLKGHGIDLNTEGGEIKGSHGVYLEQSSTRAQPIPVEFTDGTHEVPGCYYEFARRYPMPDGTLFQGFVEKSADRIFESTNAAKS